MEKQRIVSRGVLVVLTLLLLSMLGCERSRTLGKKPMVELSTEPSQQTLTSELDPKTSSIFADQAKFDDDLKERLFPTVATFGDFRSAFKEIRTHKVQESIMARVSAYTPTVAENGPNPMITASGTRVKSGVIAVSRNLYRKGWTFGKKVKIGDRVYIIADLMSKTKKDHIDVFMWTKREANNWGCQKLTVCLLSDNGG